MFSAPVRWFRRRRIPEQVGAGAGRARRASRHRRLGDAPRLTGRAVDRVSANDDAKARNKDSSPHAAVHSAPAVGRSPCNWPRARWRPRADDGPTRNARHPRARAAPDGNVCPRRGERCPSDVFPLANGPLFRRKLAGLLPGHEARQRREHLLDEIGVAASHYLVTVTAVNAGVGVLTALALWLVGVPSPLLWRAMARS
jgi:hypothetical protein